MKALLRNTPFYHRYKLAKAYFARWLYGHPSKDMVVIGITGTDGKTTTCNLTHYLINKLLGKAVVIGTTGAKIGLDRVEGVQKMTSYDPMDLQKLLATAYDAGCRYAVLEVSSHAMDQERFAGIDFDIAALTNITADHLDRHKTVDEYAKSKQKLFHALAENRQGIAVLPKDDEYGRKWIESMHFAKKIDYAVDTTATLAASNCILDKDGSHADMNYIGTEAYLDTKLVGKYNIANILAATGILLGLEQPLDGIMSALHDYQQEPGRQEQYEHLGCDWYVDFAHTVNGLRVTLEYLSSIKKDGRLICVFGCPGERDVYKRPDMSKVVSEIADIAILTDDDAAGEDRWDILDDARRGLVDTDLGVRSFIIPQRRLAIQFAKEILKPGDIILLAGKGHEEVYITNFGKETWSEREEIYR